MSNSMQHWNGHQLCAIDIEATGEDPFFHEMIQIAILPLDSNIEIRGDVPPFYINIIPEHPERANPQAMEVNRLKFAEIAKNGFDREKSKDILIEWVDRMDLPFTKFGNRKKLIPLGQNLYYDIPFIKRWLGVSDYHEIFFPCPVDTMVVASFKNDRAACHADHVPYPKINLSYLCNIEGIDRIRSHDALQDCVATAALYRKMCYRGLTELD